MTTAGHPTQTMMSVWFLPKDHKRKKDIPAIETGTLCTEKTALLGTVMLQTIIQLFSLLNLLSF